MSVPEHRVDVDGGKYTFISDPGEWRIRVLRYSEEWLEISQGAAAIHAMACELDAARVICAGARAALAARDWDMLKRCILQHDALVGDSYPPSAWTAIEVEP